MSFTSAIGRDLNSSSKCQAAYSSRLFSAVTCPVGRTSSNGLSLRRAFELYCARGREDAHDLGGWLSAERELHAVANVSMGCLNVTDGVPL